MFVDVQGFTPLSETYGPIYIVELLNIYFSRISDILSRNGGEVIKYIGDGIMAHFETSEGAIAAAYAIVLDREPLARELANAGIGSITLRVGVAWGPAILCHVGPQTHKDRTLLGDTVNTAARLESAAKPGTALLDANLLQGHKPEEFGLVLLPRGVTLKGKSNPVPVMTFRRDRARYEEDGKR